jgi:hypothetical protein
MDRKYQIRAEQWIDLMALICALAMASIIFFALSGCSTPGESDDHRYIPISGPRSPNVKSDYGDYGEIVNEFKLKVFGSTGFVPVDRITSIEWAGDSEGDRLGTCYLWYDGTKTYGNIVYANIRLDPQLRNAESRMVRIVMFHELGHCIMASDHVDDPLDLMNPTVPYNITDQEIEDRIDHYMNRLANP